MIEHLLALTLLIILSPLLGVLYLLVKLTSPGPFIFKQKRAGKNRKPFTMYKIRTMVENAENLKSKIYYLNEADGPVFKIRNDPRYTKIGRFLSRTGIDELPQLVNVIKGEMSFIDPRPLPTEEAKKIPKKYERRFFELPGISSPWVIKGASHLNFDQWMKLDLEYVDKKIFWYDISITFQTIALLLKLFFKNLW